MTYQEIVKAIVSLPIDEQDSLLELIRQQHQQRAEAHVSSNDEQLAISSSDRVTNQNTSHHIPQRTPADTAEGLRKFEEFFQSKRDLWASMTEEEREISDSQFAMLNGYLDDRNDCGYLTKQKEIFDQCLPDIIDEYAGKCVVFENGRVIDADPNQNILLARVLQSDFGKNRIERYQAVFYDNVPPFLNKEFYLYMTSQENIFKESLPELVAEYGGQYIILGDGRVLDHDISEDALLDRVEQIDFYKQNLGNDKKGIYCDFVPREIKY